MRVQGTVRPPGDKSISHRALLVGALARGPSRFSGLLPGEDVQSTARVLRQLGAEIGPVRDGDVVTVRPHPFRTPVRVLHCGNSGTTARLLLGVLAGHPFAARLTGDQSLRRRPMGRVAAPLRAMGARVTDGSGDRLPLTIRGGRLRALDYTSPVASAQVKSALLLAGFTGNVSVTLREPYRSRDHTERLFLHLGLPLREAAGAVIYDAPERRPRLPGFELAIPGDASSAAFLVAAAALAEGGELLVENVGVNPTRTGFLVVLARMGVPVERLNLRDAGGEPVADLLVRAGAVLGPTEVQASEVPALVDEVPILAALASRASGETIFRAVGELRVKESDRLELVARNLRAVGVRAEVQGDDLHVQGSERPPAGAVETARDHRLAMAFAVLGTLPGAAIRLSERRSVAISYPAFFRDLKRIRRARDRD